MGRFRLATIAVLTASLGFQASAQTAPFLTHTCTSARLHAAQAVALARLCEDAFYLRGELDEADAACSASSDKLTELGKLLSAAAAEGMRCDDRGDLDPVRPTLAFVLAFTDYRIDGHVPPKKPNLPPIRGVLNPAR